MKVLFICTGNTCRSPMAEGFYNHFSGGASSCGLFAREGERVSENAVKAAAAYGTDISAHRARLVNRQLLSSADKIYCMTKNHLDALIKAYPECSDKAFTISDRPVSDPYMGDLRAYESVAAELYAAVKKIVEGQN